MSFVDLSIDDGTATVMLDRPKVNALNEPFVDELISIFRELSGDPDVGAVVLTGRGSFFSFGFDIPEFIDYPKESFLRYLMKFSELVRDIFIFPKPVIAALNGHAVAGGCILAIACDQRVMVDGKAKIALNELTFGSTVFTSIVEILRYIVGSGTAQNLLYSGRMLSAEDALALGLVDEVCTAEELQNRVLKQARDLSARDTVAFRSVKKLLKRGVLEKIEREEKDSVSEFVEIWYSEKTRENLKKIEVRS